MSSSLLLRGSKALAIAAALALPAFPVVGQSAERDAEARAAISSEKGLSRALEQTLAEVMQIAASGGAGEIEKAALRSLTKELRRHDNGVRQGFAAVEKQLKAAKASATLMERHQAAVRRYGNEMNDLIVDVVAIDSAKPETLQAATAKVQARLAYLIEATPTYVRPKLRAPRLYDREFDAVNLGKSGRIAGDLPELVNTPGEEDLSPSEAVQITAEIQALAEQLHRDPVAIKNFVTNEIAYVPYFGAVQGSKLTLETRRGNAFDQASLLIALLRASGVPARHVLGTIEVPVERLQNWLGGLTEPQAALELLADAGIPAQPVVNGGRIAGVRLEHAWAEAWLDVVPSRASRHRSGDNWTELDPSFKQLTLKTGMGLTGLPSYSGSLTGSATSDPTSGWISGLDPSYVSQELIGFGHRLAASLGQVASLDALLGSGSIAPDGIGIAASNLPYPVVAHARASASLTDADVQRFRLALYASEADQGNGQPLIDYSTSLPALAGQTLSLSFVPASAADRDLLKGLLPLGSDGRIDPARITEGLPGYLLQVKAELRVGDVVVATGGPVVFGSRLFARLDTTRPGSGLSPSSDSVVAGEFRVFEWDAHGGMGPRLAREAAELAQVQAELSTHDYSRLSANRLAGAPLRSALAVYFAANDLYDGWLAPMYASVAYRAPTLGSARTVLSVDSFFGIPRSVSFSGLALTANQLRSTEASSAHLTAQARALRGHMAALGSSLGHEVLERGFDQPSGAAASSLRSLAIALSQGQRIYQLFGGGDPQLADVSPTPSLRARIEAALAAGREVYVPAQEISTLGWQGRGAVIVDPLTGEGEFPIYGTGGQATAALIGDTAFLGWGGIADGIDASLLAGLYEGKSNSIKQLAEWLIPVVNAPLSIGPIDAVTNLASAALINQQGVSGLTTLLGVPASSLLAQASPWLTSQMADPYPPDVTLVVSPQSPSLGQALTLQVTASDNAGAPSVGVTVDGAPISPAADGSYSFTPTSGGQYGIVATVTDAAGNVTVREVSVMVTDPSDTQGPFVALVNPVEGDRITSPTAVIGTVQDASLASWKLSVLAPGGKIPWVLAEGTKVFDQQAAGTLDPSQLVNGLHTLILEAADAGGVTSRAVATVSVEGNLKVGNFSITFEDLTVALSGLPITITRTYDSRERHESFDFGHGWRIGYQSVRLQESARAGRSWRINSYGGIFGQKCVESNGDRLVTVTLPGGKVEKFKAVASPRCSQIAPTTHVNLVYEAVDGTYSKLEQTDYGLLQLVGEDLIELGGMDPVADPTHYRLTSAEGIVYEIDQNFGIKRIVEPGGNALEFSASGILHKGTGVTVKFTRDADGRIQRITAPDGTSLNYTYDLNGDLARFSDRDAAQTQFAYDRRHYLTDITDPRGVRVARNLYDDDGRLVAQIDANGNRLEYTHDIAGRREIVRDRNGNATLYTYDDSGNVLSETNALNETTRHTYDGRDNELTRTDPLGRVTSWSYERYNKLTETNAKGEATRWTYACNDAIESETNALGQQVLANSYKSIYPGGVPVCLGWLLSTGNAAGEVMRFGYTDGGDLTSMTDPLGKTTQFGTNYKGEVVSTTDPLGVATTYTLDANGNRLSETTKRTDGNGQQRTLVTGHSYDSKGRLLSTTDPLGNTTRTEYNVIGKESAHIDALGRRTEYEYDERGNRIRIRYPDGTTESIGFDPENNKIAETDRAGRTTRYEYDAAKRLTKITRHDGTFTQNSYDAAGQLNAETDALGRRMQYAYDAAGRRAEVIDAGGNKTAYSYDAAGRQTAVTDALGQTTRFEYDLAGRRTKTLFPDGSSVSASYDAGGRKSAESDQAGKITRFEYDAAGRLTQVTDALGNVTAYGYDEQGNKTSQTDAEGRVTKWAYDDGGRQISRTLPEGQSETFAYDAAGNRTRHTDFNGGVTTYAYDTNNREIRRTHADGTTIATTYTPSGQVDRVTDARGVTDHDYDAMDRLAKITYPNGMSIEYSYDSLGNKVSLKSAGRTITYRYTEVNQLEAVTEHNGTTSYLYDALGRQREVRYPNGAVTTTNYDVLNRPLVVETRDKAGTVVSRTAYTLDAAGHRTRLVELDRTVDYTYDALYRVTSETITAGTDTKRVTSWLYDRVGNRIRQDEAGSLTAYTYDKNDRLLTETTAAGVTTYSYDANGNTTQKSGPDGTTTYAWNQDNRLIGTTTPTDQLAFTYDASGIRQSRTVNGITTEFVVDPNQAYAQVLAEYQGGAEQVAYTYGNDLLAQNRAGAASYFHYDALGSTRALTDGAGVLTDAYAYKAFGEIAAQRGATPNAYLYTGEQWDSGLKQYYLRARYLDPRLGRFSALDPWAGNSSRPLTQHKYVYASLCPSRAVDPSGLSPLGEMMQGVNLQGVLTSLSQISGRTLVKKAGCFVAEAAVEEAITGAIYVFLDGFTGLPYVGKTTQDVEDRLDQHRKEGRRSVERVLATFHITGGEDILQLAEQYMIDLLGGLKDEEGNKNLSNKINAINERRGRLKFDLIELRACK